tara:strand:+ start:408 stop:731 length:324 start_codon:yes stop_codon:yes gene_type:complete
MSDFNPAFSKELKWNVGENTYAKSNPNNKFTKRLGLFIPLESIKELKEYIDSKVADPDSVKSTKIWNSETQNAEPVNGIWLSGNGMSGEYGDFGSINPPALEDDRPF